MSDYQERIVGLATQPNAISARFPESRAKVFVRGVGEMIIDNLPPAEELNAAARGGTIDDIIKQSLDNKYQEARGAFDAITNGMTPTQKAAILGGQIPIGGDILGMAADMEMYIQDPESRTLFNGLLTGLSALPLVPAVSQFRSLDEVIDAAKKRGVDLSVSDRANEIVVNKIVVPPDSRGAGIGSEVMGELTEFADSSGRQITLTPSTDFGASSKGRLSNFYKRFGFVENSGKNKDYTISEGMFRPPLVAPAEQVKRNINAWHGSPHKFDKFSMQNIGTGEGAQAYGHGLYFAENPAVAGQYQEALMKGKKKTQIASRLNMPDSYETELFAKHLDDNNGDIAGALSSLDEYAASFAKEGDQQTFNNLTAFGDRVREKYPSGGIMDLEEDFGSLYNVNLNVDPDDLLDWDAPLSEQSERVRSSIDQLLQDNPDNMGLQALAKYPEEMRGEQIYERVVGMKGSGSLDGDMEASQLLRGSGIPGIKYLDGTSRSAGEGTRNFVMFDDSLVDIKTRNGEALTPVQRQSAVSEMMGGGSVPAISQVKRNINAWHENPRLFHGTAATIDKFDPSYGGSVTKARSAKMGTWLVDDPEVAGGYARMAAEDAPVQKLIDASQAAERRGDWDKAHDLIAEAEQLEQSGDLVGGGGQNIMPLQVRGSLMDFDAGGATMSGLDDSQLFEWSKEAKKAGKEGLRITNFSDNADYGTYTPATHYLIFDPENIRSSIGGDQLIDIVDKQ